MAMLFYLASCQKDDPVYNNIPEIELISATPSTVKQYKDSIVFVISYKDGDGDLGENSADAKNLFLTDNRINITYDYRIPQLSPDGSHIIIKGQLSVVLKSTGITDGSTQQMASYSIYVKDRAGNKSNVVTTPILTIQK